MRQRVLYAGLFLSTAVLLVASAAVSFGGGLSLFPLVYGIDVEETLSRIPVAGDAAALALADELTAEGAPASLVEDVVAGFGDVTVEISQALSSLSTTWPVPLVGGSLEIGLPLLLLDGVRMTIAGMSDGLVRGVADLAGVEIPAPLVNAEFDTDGSHFSLSGDVEFQSWLATTELVKRFDLFLAAVEMGAGIAWLQGRVTPLVQTEVPPEYDAAVHAALAALHLDGFTWSSFSLSGSVSLELGPPFLRLQLRACVQLPVVESSGWWSVRPTGWGLSLGLGVRF
jgi:hypothetical protein